MNKWNEVITSNEMKTIGKDMLDVFVDALSGDYKAWGELAVLVTQSPMSAKILLFYCNFRRFLDGIEYEENLMRDFLEFLNREDKREENSKRIIQLIDELDSDYKVDALINLTKSVSYGFISKREYFKLARIVQDEIVEDLQYIQKDIKKGEFNKTEISEEFVHRELMYLTAKSKYAYTQRAFHLDKYALSYGNDKYKYNGELDCVPTREQMPDEFHPLFAELNGKVLDINMD